MRAAKDLRDSPVVLRRETDRVFEDRVSSEVSCRVRSLKRPCFPGRKVLVGSRFHSVSRQMLTCLAGLTFPLDPIILNVLSKRGQLHMSAISRVSILPACPHTKSDSSQVLYFTCLSHTQSEIVTSPLFYLSVPTHKVRYGQVLSILPVCISSVKEVSSTCPPCLMYRSTCCPALPDDDYLSVGRGWANFISSVFNT